MIRRVLLVGSFLTASSLPAFAHLNPLEHGSFAAGASHPLFGADHILAMVGVGLWAALLGGRSIWAAPGAFVAAMVAGFIAALMHIGLPFVEPVIAASIVVLGLLALVALQVPTPVGMAMVGFFAFFHGYAHGGEIADAGAMLFMVGFALSTAFLHAVGVGIGLLAGRFGNGVVARTIGGLTALGGLWIAAGN